MFYSLIGTLYTLLVVILLGRLLLSGARPTKTLAWLMVILFIPVFGIILYATLGVNRRRYRFHQIKENPQIESHLRQVQHFIKNPEDLKEEYDVNIADHLQMMRLNSKSSDLWATGGNAIQVLNDGFETFESIFRAVEKAEKFVHLQYYIFEDGDLADRFLAIFERKRANGVEIRLLYDGVGSFSLSKSFLERLKAAGVKIHIFFPLRFGKISRHVNYRNHRKIIVIDGKVGFIGGINVSDKYIVGDPILGKWHDLHLKMEGPAVWSLNAVFTMDWFLASGEEDLLDARHFPKVKSMGASTVQIVAAGPDSPFPAIQYEYLAIINGAKEYLYIANPYVIPGESILNALKISALSEVDVRILLPEKSDSKFVNWCTRSYFVELMESGVKIFLYQQGFLHSKLIISDDSLASVGTANLDVRSFEQNFEVNALLLDKDVARQLKREFILDLENSRQLELDKFRARPLMEKILEGFSRILSPLM